ncbi:MAG: hypothetical protein JSU63_19080 [Phycisphaerales bacterium]|nr:MAG: hypothetical protein JSU63_19080 [Phycisphaerales bacterium]
MMGRVTLCCLLVLAFCLMNWGCSFLVHWSSGDRSSSSPHEAHPVSDAGSPGSSFPQRGGTTDYPSPVIEIAFDLLRTELPMGSVRHSQKIWNHVDELRVDPGLSGRLARNGLRMGAASADAWPAIRAILAACDTKAQQDQLFAQGGLPVVIELGSIDSSESVFSYGPDNRLIGKTFPAGSKLMIVDYAIHTVLGGYTDFKITFEVRHDRGVMTWERRGGIIRQVPAYDRHVYADLSAALPINQDEFLVVGPSNEADKEYLVGNRFFMKQQGDVQSETLLFVTPVPYQTQQVPQRTR